MDTLGAPKDVSAEPAITSDDGEDEGEEEDEEACDEVEVSGSADDASEESAQDCKGNRKVVKQCRRCTCCLRVVGQDTIGQDAA